MDSGDLQESHVVSKFPKHDGSIATSACSGSILKILMLDIQSFLRVTMRLTLLFCGSILPCSILLVADVREMIETPFPCTEVYI